MSRRTTALACLLTFGAFGCQEAAPADTFETPPVPESPASEAPPIEPPAVPAEPPTAGELHVVVPPGFVAPAAGRWDPHGFRIQNDTTEHVAVFIYRGTSDVWGWVEREVAGEWRRPPLECGFMLSTGTLAPGEGAALNFSDTHFGAIRPGRHRISVDAGRVGELVASAPFDVSP